MLYPNFIDFIVKRKCNPSLFRNTLYTISGRKKKSLFAKVCVKYRGRWTDLRIDLIHHSAYHRINMVPLNHRFAKVINHGTKWKPINWIDSSFVTSRRQYLKITVRIILNIFDSRFFSTNHRIKLIRNLLTLTKLFSLFRNNRFTCGFDGVDENSWCHREKHTTFKNGSKRDE